MNQMKGCLFLLGGVSLFYLLPLAALAALIGWVVTWFSDVPWMVASLISFLILMLLLSTLDLVGEWWPRSSAKKKKRVRVVQTKEMEPDNHAEGENSE